MQFISSAVFKRGLLLVAYLPLLCETSLSRLSIHPVHLHTKSGRSASVTCSIAQTIITRCQFRVRPLGQESRDVRRVHLSNATVNYGPGTGVSTCYTTLSDGTLDKEGSYGVTCRVRTDETDWLYASMTVFKYESEAILINITSRERVVMPGTNVSIFFQSELQLLTCAIKLESWKSWQKVDENYPPCGNTALSYCYYGYGLWKMECGVTIKDVTNAYNGNILFEVTTLDGRKEVDSTRFIVAKPPNATELVLNEINHNDVTKTIHALCTVSGSRPAANVTWYLGGDRISDNFWKHVPREKWVEPHEDQTTTQQLTMKVGKNDDGKMLWCAAQHLALVEPLNSTKFAINITGSSTNSEMDDPMSTTYTALSSSITSTTTSTDHSSTETTLADAQGNETSDKSDDTLSLLLVIIGLLVALTVCGGASVVIYTWYKSLLCFATHATVKYRQSLDTAGKGPRHSRPVDGQCHVQSPQTCVSTSSSSNHQPLICAAIGEYAEVQKPEENGDISVHYAELEMTKRKDNITGNVEAKKLKKKNDITMYAEVRKAKKNGDIPVLYAELEMTKRKDDITVNLEAQKLKKENDITLYAEVQKPKKNGDILVHYAELEMSKNKDDIPVYAEVKKPKKNSDSTVYAEIRKNADGFKK